MNNATMQSSPWLINANAGRPLRLYCFCYAGGNAQSYLGWARHLPDVEIRAIQLPGRGNRFLEPPLRRFDALIDTLSGVLAREPADRPFAFFGHSLGALVAFELARTQARRGLPLPAHLFVSGCAAPRHRPPPDNLHLLDDAGLLQRLRELNGTPPEILEHAELMAVLLPTIRADMALVADYVYRPGAPLAMPLTVLAGRADDVAAGAQTDGWGEETTGPFAAHWYDGDHFFINGARAAVLAQLRASLAPLARRAVAA